MNHAVENIERQRTCKCHEKFFERQQGRILSNRGIIVVAQCRPNAPTDADYLKDRHSVMVVAQLATREPRSYKGA